jgi:pimeloyl-ACP methyl ester carboxylesterase
MAMTDDTKRIEANGLEFAYLEAGAGPLVLLLHGFPDTAYSFSAMLPRLAEAGYHAVAPFQRGYYPTAIPDDGDYSVLTLARDALALIAAFGKQTAVIVGHDWGASSGYVAANLEPERVSKLVTIAIPHLRVIRPTPRFFWRASHFLLLQFGRLSEWYVRRKDFAYLEYLCSCWSPNWRPPKHEIDTVKDGFRRPGRLTAALGYYRALFADARTPAKQEIYRRKTAVPTLAFAGGSDGALDVTIYERTREAFTAPYEVVVFAKAGHFLHREQPEDFTRKLLQFLGPPS